MGTCTSACSVNWEACAWLDHEFDPAAAQMLLVKEGHTAAGVVDSPRSVASCSTSDLVEEIAAQKHVLFSAAPDEVLHIVPYSEMYLTHPSKFEFDRDGLYITRDKSVDANLRAPGACQKIRKHMHSARHMLSSKDAPRQIVIGAGGLVSSTLEWLE